jgi:large subunit ribosomal protein L29
MKVSEFSEMSKDELANVLHQLRDEHFKLRLRRGTEELPNPLRLRIIRRDIARVLTILREIELGKRKVIEKKTVEKKAAEKEKKVAVKKTKERKGATKRA